MAEAGNEVLFDVVDGHIAVITLNRPEVRNAVNGAVAAQYGTHKMLFSARHFISRISRYMTLQPGDVIWLGTDGATEPDLHDGDTVEVSQPDIGVLRNPVRRARV